MKARWCNLTQACCIIALTVPLFCGCEEENNGLMPYSAGGRPMSSISVEENVYVPRLSWLGGHVSVLGVNSGPTAILDSTLVWLVRIDGNNIRFPIRFGENPAGAEDLTTTYGGAAIDTLYEDSTYTFWVLKEDAWGIVSQNAGKAIVTDTTLSAPAQVLDDTVYVSAMSSTQLEARLDVYLNIKNVVARGRLALLDVHATNRDNNPVVTWSLTQSDVTDTAVAILGLVEGGTYDINTRVWEVATVDTVDGMPVFRSLNILPPPVVMGEQYERTAVFAQYPGGGLERSKIYYFYIANKDWDGVGRFRSTPYYAYMTFETW